MFIKITLFPSKFKSIISREIFQDRDLNKIFKFFEFRKNVYYFWEIFIFIFFWASGFLPYI